MSRKTVSRVTLGSAGYGPVTLLLHIERTVRDTCYAPQVVSTVEGDPAGIVGAVDSLPHQGVDGIIVSEPVDEGTLRVAVDVPVVFLGTPPAFTAPRAVTMRLGAFELAKTATEHLLELGHATVHHLAGPQRWYTARDRRAGWRAALAERTAGDGPAGRTRRPRLHRPAGDVRVAVPRAKEIHSGP